MALIPTTQVNVSPDDYKKKMAYALLTQGSSGEPIQHWTQGLNRLAQGLLGGYQTYQAEEKQKQDEADASAAYLKFLGQGSTPAAPVASPAPQPAPSPVTAALGKPAKMVSADPAAVTGPRPNGPVMPSDKVWGDDEAEAAGLYEKKPTKVAMALSSSPLDSAQWPYGPVGGPSSAAAAPPAAATPAAPTPTAPQMDDAKAKIAQLLNSPNRSERMLGRSLAEAAITNQITGSKPTDEIREYEYSLKNPGFTEYKTGLKKAGATNVSVDTKGENAFAQEAGKSQAKRYDEIAASGQNAKQMLSDVQTLAELGNNIKTGKMAQAKAMIGPYADALGIKVDGLNEIQAFEAITNRVAPSLRVPGSGAQSDFELKNFLKSLPSLANTAEGNAIVTRVMGGLQQNKIAAAEIASRALAREITPAQADKMLRDLPDPMEEYRAFIKNSGSGNSPARTNSLKQKYGLD